MEHLLTSSDINRDWLYLLQLGVDVLANWHSLFFLCASITFPIQLLFLLEKLLTKIMENAKMVRFDILKSFRWPQNMHMVHWIYCEIVDLCILVLAKISGASLHFLFFFKSLDFALLIFVLTEIFWEEMYSTILKWWWKPGWLKLAGWLFVSLPIDSMGEL